MMSSYSIDTIPEKQDKALAMFAISEALYVIRPGRILTCLSSRLGHSLFCM